MNRENRFLYSYLPHFVSSSLKHLTSVPTILPNIPDSLSAPGPVSSNLKSLPDLGSCWRIGSVPLLQRESTVEEDRRGMRHVPSNAVCASIKPTKAALVHPHSYLTIKISNDTHHFIDKETN